MEAAAVDGAEVGPETVAGAKVGTVAAPVAGAAVGTTGEAVAGTEV